MFTNPALCLGTDGSTGWIHDHGDGKWTTLSVYGMYVYKPRAIREPLHQCTLYRMNTIAVQETRLHGSDIMDMRTHTIFKSGKFGGGHELGAFVVDKKFKQQVINFKSIDERLCAIRIQTKFYKMWLINVHAPIKRTKRIQKDEF